jgi:hypothetical protein
MIRAVDLVESPPRPSAADHAGWSPNPCPTRDDACACDPKAAAASVALAGLSGRQGYVEVLSSLDARTSGTKEGEVEWLVAPTSRWLPLPPAWA